MMKAWAAILVLFLAACQAGGGAVPPEVRMKLVGDWQEVDGGGRLHFYEDGSVKLAIPDRIPPLKLISVYEQMKDSAIGIESGDFWSGPIRCHLYAGGRRLSLVLPDEKARVRYFVKRETRRR